jgi:hypothetical protein
LIPKPLITSNFRPEYLYEAAKQLLIKILKSVILALYHSMYDSFNSSSKELGLFLHIFKAQTILCHRQYLMVLGGPKGDCQVQIRSTSLGRDHVFTTNTITDIASPVPRFCSINSRDEVHLQIRNCDQKLPKMDEKRQLAS